MPAGIAVDFYEGTDATGTLLGTGMTDKALLPGGSTKVQLVVPAPMQGMTKDFFVEVDDESEGKAETRAFLDRRIEGVMTFEKVKAKWLNPEREHFSLSRFLGRLRYPAR